MKVLNVPTTKKVIKTTGRKSFLDTRSSFHVKNVSLREKVILLLIRDLIRLGWKVKTGSKKSFEFIPPSRYSKQIIRHAMAYSRQEIIKKNEKWLNENLELCKKNLARGRDVIKSKIIPSIEICQTQEQNNLFRGFRYYWSSPASDYVGRRIRFLIRDNGLDNRPIIGIAALGSSIIHIPDRDEWIGWDLKTRTERIIYMMDAYVLGALPPYNYLLGGKLISYMLASNEIRELYKEKYKKAKTIISKRKASDLALIMTTSLYGRNSSQYNRLKYGKSLLYKPVGETAGYGSLHISNETFLAMKELAEKNGCNVSNVFGMGPNWRMRVIRAACDVLDLDSDIILKHSFKRGLFSLQLATNFRSFLKGDTNTPKYRNIPLERVVDFWENRWLNMRKKNSHICEMVKNFQPSGFIIK